MGWRALLHLIPILDRRWIARPEEREAHAEIVRERLDSGPADAPTDPSDPPETESEAPGTSPLTGRWR